MKNKPIIVLLAVLFLVSASAGTYGYMHSKDENVKPTPEPPKPTITYEYYLEDHLVAEMPNKIDDNGNQIEYSKYYCDNNMTLDFDEEAWAYMLSNEVEGVCKIYFVRSEYKVTITATNALINGEEASYDFFVPRGTGGSFNIIPNEGYEYKVVSCANDKEAVYDISTNMLNINYVSEDTACKIDFDKRNLKLDIVVKNGTGTTTEYKDYGESISAIVQPNEGYEKPKIECTNNQEFTYKDNQLTIAKLTDDSKCTVTFSKTPAVTYNLIIDNIPEQVTITSGNKQQSVVSGKDGKFSLRAEDGYIIILDCNGVKPSNEQADPDGTITYTFLGVSRNITCNITTQYEEPQIDESNGE